MSITLQKSNGDLFLDAETGQGVVVNGPNKVSQELADLYLTDFDSDRNWGSEFKMDQFALSSMRQSQSILFLKLNQANARILVKQSEDPNLDSTEKITLFSQADVVMDMENQALLFYSVADLGLVTVEQMVGISLKPTSLKHVIAPPPEIIPSQ